MRKPETLARRPWLRRDFLKGPIAAGAWCATNRLLAASPGSGWRAGVGRTKITPSGPVWMAGYGSRNRECDVALHDLWAKALALAAPDGQRAVLLALDSCGISREVAAMIALAVEQRFGLSRADLLINHSHSHCSPFTEGLVHAMRDFTPGERDRIAAYTRWLEQQAVAAVGAALAGLEPVTLTHGKSEAKFAVNRRNNAEAEVPQRRAENKLAGPVDHDVPVLAVRHPNGRVKAVVYNYACHTTTLNLYEWNGDFAGFANEEIERRHPGATAFFTAGCGGDINPVPRRALDLAQGYGRDLADAVDRVLGTEMTPIKDGLRTAMDRVDLAFAASPTRDELQATLDAPETPRNRYKRIRARYLLGELARGEKIMQSYPYPIQCWRLGDLAWIALGGEPVVEYSLALKESLGPNIWALGYSNEIMAYIPSERVLQEGGYEGATSMEVFGLPAPWASGLEQKILATAQRLARA